MNLEKIKNEFVKDIELIIDQKNQELTKLDGLNKLKAKEKHLDELNVFADLMNKKINEIIDKQAEQFQNDDEFNKFYQFIKPTFDILYLKYVELAKM